MAFVGAAGVAPQTWFIYAWAGLAFVLAVFHKPLSVKVVLVIVVLVIAYFILQIKGWLPALGVVALFAVAIALWKLGADAQKRGATAAHDYLHGGWQIITAAALFWAYGLLVLGW
ncbi:MAG: hypothetical protein IH951_11195 [Bacteroidetes bacterium]|nr:hypothetical protein [Bacteroidota bacterium]